MTSFATQVSCCRPVTAFDSDMFSDVQKTVVFLLASFLAYPPDNCNLQNIGIPKVLALLRSVVVNVRFLQALQVQEGHHASPLLNLLFCHLGGLL